MEILPSSGPEIARRRCTDLHPYLVSLMRYRWSNCPPPPPAHLWAFVPRYSRAPGERLRPAHQRQVLYPRLRYHSYSDDSKSPSLSSCLPPWLAFNDIVSLPSRCGVTSGSDFGVAVLPFWRRGQRRCRILHDRQTLCFMEWGW